MMQEDIGRLEKENQRLKTAVKELAALNEISRVINSTMTVEEISEQIMKKVVNVVQAKEAAVHTFSEDSETLSPHTFVRGKLDTSTLTKSRFDIRVAGWIARHKKPLLIDNPAKDERFKGIDLTDNPVTSLLAVPLTVKGKLIGALTVFNSLKPSGFTDDDIRLLGIIGVQSAQIIENARLYQEELRLKRLEGEVQAAKKIQEGFLPKSLPGIAGYDIFGATIPAKETGGDYFDFIQASEGKLFFTLGDVSGKGLPAAMLMSSIQAQARLLFNRYPDMSPCDALSELNLITCQLSGSAQFATMVVGALHVGNNEITLANGGHGYPIIVRADGGLEEITESSMLIGMFDQAQYSDAGLRLGTGDLLVIFSDGVEEAFNTDQEEFGLGRTRDCLRENRQKSAEEIYTELVRTVSEFRGDAEQSDDITMIVVKRTA